MNKPTDVKEPSYNSSTRICRSVRVARITEPAEVRTVLDVFNVHHRLVLPFSQAVPAQPGGHKHGRRGSG